MNYMPPDPTKQTSCKNCVFAIYEDKTQVGCEDNRVSKFGDLVIEAYDDSKEFYVINRLCNLYRNVKWNDGIKDVAKAKKESCLSFDILIDCDDIDNQYRNKIIEEIGKLDYPKEKYIISLFQSYTCDKTQREEAIGIHANHPTTNLSVYFDRIDYIHSFLSKSRNSFHLILNKNNIDNFSNFITSVDKLVNDDLKRFILCKSDNKLTISNTACRIIYQNLYSEYENNIAIVIEDAKKENLYIEF